MKAALLVILVGCVSPGVGAPDDASPTGTCSADSDCSAGVCASNGECMAASETQTARVVWTIDSAAPTDYTCYWTTSFKAVFQADPEPGPYQETWESPELACTVGEFTVEKLPRRFWMGGATSQSNGMWVPLDDAGTATVNLRP